MKHLLPFIIFSLVIFLTFPSLAQVGIGTTSPNSSAVLDLSSTTKGLLIPRMGSTQRTAISSPATGLIVFDTDSGYLFFYNSGWKGLKQTSSGSSQWTTSGSNIYNNNSGNVGIGNTSPAYKLDVTGLANADSFGIGGSTVLSSKGIANIFAGNSAGIQNTTGSNNSFNGVDAGYSNTIGSNIAAYGYRSLYNNTKSGNTAVGAYSGYNNTTGNRNVYLGDSAGYNNTTANANLYAGYQAGRNNNANYNIFLGFQAGKTNSTGDANIFLGTQAGVNNSSGRGVTAIGFLAGASNSSGTNNTYLGYAANGSGTLTNATAIGANANVTSSNSVILGYNASVGIGTSSPDAKLEVNGSIKLDTLAGTGSRMVVTDSSGNLSAQTIPTSGSTYTAGTGISISGGTITNTGLTSTTAGGDLSGTYPNPAVAKLQGTSVSSTAPSGNQVLKYNSTTSKWEPGTDNNSTYTGSNGVTVTGANVSLGGSLTGATTLTTSSTNTLKLTGVQTGAASDSLVTLNNGIIRKIATTSAGTNYFTASGSNIQNNNAGNVGIGKAPNHGLDVSNGINTDSAYMIGGVRVLSSGRANLNAGLYAGKSNTSGYQNTNIGDSTGYANTTGNQNTIVGFQAGATNSTGAKNVFIGAQAGNRNTTASSNHMVGYHAGFNTTTGNSNYYSGYQAGFSNTTGGGNTVIGFSANYNDVTGSNNTVLGNSAGFKNTASNNFFVGNNAGFSNVTGTYVTAIGYNSLYNNLVGTNVAVGPYTGFSNISGTYNVFIGDSSGYKNTTGINNTFVGYQTGVFNSTGYANTFIGQRSGNATTTGAHNTFMGNLSGSANTTGTSNTYLGYQAGTNNNAGSNNICIGDGAGKAGNGYSGNTIVGYQSGLNTSTGYGNTISGVYAGNTNTTGSRNTLIGDSADVSASGLTNATAIGYNADAGASNTLILGNGARVGIGTSTPVTDFEVAGAVRLDTLAGTGSRMVVTDGNGLLSTQAITSNYWSRSGTTLSPVTSGDLVSADSFGIGGTKVLSSAGTANLMLGKNAGAKNTGSNNLFIGEDAGRNVTTGTNNQFIGYQAGYSSTTGTLNHFFGYQAGYAITSGRQNHFEGYQAGLANTSGDYNYFSGYSSGMRNTTGSNNSFAGHRAGQNNTTGSNNVFMGFYAGTANTTGNDNVSIGYSAGGSISKNSDNTFVGHQAGSSSSGYSNSAFGSYAGKTNTSGIRNTFIGDSADATAGTLTNATAIGYNASVGASNSLVLGNAANVGIGQSIPGFPLNFASTTGDKISMYGNSGAHYGFGIQNALLQTYTDASTSDIAFGYGSSSSFTENMRIKGSGNVGIGTSSPGVKLDVVNANGIGIRALSGSSSSYISYSIGRTATEGEIGMAAASGNYSTDASAGDIVFRTSSTSARILLNSGSGASGLSVYGTNVGIGVASPTYKLQVNGQPAANGYTAFTNYSDRRLKENIRPIENTLDRILKLNPVEFNYNALSGLDEASRQRKIKGFVAQEVKELFPDMVGQTKLNGMDYYDLNLSHLLPYMVKAIQEQEQIINDVRKTNEELKNKVEALVSKNNELEMQQSSNASLKALIEQVRDAQIACCRAQGNLEAAAKLDIPVLEQNNPNPFTDNTVIKYYLPSTDVNATITITTVDGKTLQSFKNLGTGNGHILINGSALAAGTYYYNLVIDGKQVDSKKMMLVK